MVMMYVRFPLSLRNVEDLLFERGIDICQETVRQWWNRFGPMFAGDIRRQLVGRMQGFRQWRWHLDEMYVKLNGERSTYGGRSTRRARSSRAISPGPATHFNSERHLVDRQTYKTRRSAALAEWQSLMT